MEQRPVNRRSSARHVCQLQVDYNAGRGWRRATALDLSPHGCRLRLGEELARGTPVSVRFTQPTAGGDEISAQLDGTLIWLRVEGLSYQAGVHFPGGTRELEAIIATLG